MPKKEKDELDDVEAIPREQAEQEIRQAAKNAQKQEQSSSKSDVKDELDDVETIPREQAEQEIRQAARKVAEDKDR